MASDHQTIGSVKGGKSNSSDAVTWYPISGEVYVSYAGGSYVGNASSPRDAGPISNALLGLLPGGPDRDAAVYALARLRERLDVPGVPDRAARWVLATARR